MKKIISLFTALCIVFGVLGTFIVFADDTAADLEISTLAELEAFRDDVNNGNTYEGKTVKLTADIDMSEKYGEGKENWISIGDWKSSKCFSGTFDGDNYTINGLYINNTGEGDEYGIDHAALFYGLNGGGAIKNLNVQGYVSVAAYSGNAAGIAIAVYKNCVIDNCSFNGVVKSDYYQAGGIVLDNGGLILNCKTSGSVIGMHLGGGIASTGDGTIQDCINEADIIGTTPVGGIAGINGKILRCINKGNVTGRTMVDGDWINPSSSIGGIAGGIDVDCTIEDCYNIGVISGDTVVGGIVGEAVKFSWDEYENGKIINCYNLGEVKSTFETENEHYIGGIAGKTAGIDYNGEDDPNLVLCDVANCYYLDSSANKGIAVYGDGEDTTTALTAEQFANQSSFENWDFDTVWAMDEALGRPILQSNREAPPALKYNIEYKDGSAIVTVPQEGAYTIIFASYKEGRLLSVNAQDKQFKKGRNEPIAPQNFNAEGNIKIMLWDSLESMKPFAVTELLSDTFIQ